MKLPPNITCRKADLNWTLSFNLTYKCSVTFCRLLVEVTKAQRPYCVIRNVFYKERTASPCEWALRPIQLFKPMRTMRLYFKRFKGLSSCKGEKWKEDPKAKVRPKGAAQLFWMLTAEQASSTHSKQNSDLLPAPKTFNNTTLCSSFHINPICTIWKYIW